MKVVDCMTHQFVKLQPTSTIQDVLEQFLQKRSDIGCVLDANGRLAGIISKYSIYRMLTSGYAPDTPIEPFIVHEVTTICSHATLYEARDILLEAKVANAVITDREGRVCGVLGKGDIIQGFLLGEKRLATQLASLIETLEDGVVGIDANSRIHTFNPAAERMFQLPASSVLGRSTEALPLIGTDLTYAMQTQFPAESRKIRLPASIALSTYAPVVFQDEVIGAIAVLKDLTAYEKIAFELETTKKLERTLESALELAYDGIAIADADGQISMVNDALLELYGASRQNLLHAKADEKLPELDLAETLRTGQECVGAIQEVNGRRCVITRMPIIRNEKSVGAIAKVMFRQLDHYRDLFSRLEHLENELSYYRGEYLRVTTLNTALDHIITRSPAMEALKQQAYLGAQGSSTVLITGESGTGKELFAQAVHEISGRPGRFVKVNCAAIPAELLESEFFGYADGAFTGARKGGKPGKFELADGGTLFLDEIGDMPLPLQAKLLRVLQERSFERVGDTRTIQVNVRIVAATNHQLAASIREGKFREDLYYRINVIHLAIPPLRERKEDLPLLCEHLIHKLNRVLHKSIKGVSPATLAKLREHDWPGNVRELENVLERALNLDCRDWVEPRHLPPGLFTQSGEEKDEPASPKGSSGTKWDVLADAEKQLILGVLQECRGNRSRAAEQLGVSRSTLYQKMKKLGIEEKSQFV